MSARSLDHDGDTMTELVRTARAAWPEVDLAPEVFAPYLRSRLPDAAESELAWSQLQTNDLYLACACARGDPHAIAAFERHCLGALDATLRKVAGVTPDVIDDVKQQLRRSLLVADARPPGILEFSGRGELRRWLRVIAVREALGILQRSRREVPSEQDSLEKALLPALDLEKQYLKKLYQKEFTQAVAKALGALSVHDQLLLRQAFVDGLSIDEIGRLYRVHRATAARWLSRAQVALSRQTRVILMQKLAVNPAELHSILRLLRSGLDLSLRLVFARQRKKRT